MLVKGTETNIFFSSGKRDKSCVLRSSVNACVKSRSFTRLRACARAWKSENFSWNIVTRKLSRSSSWNAYLLWNLWRTRGSRKQKHMVNTAVFPSMRLCRSPFRWIFGYSSVCRDKYIEPKVRIEGNALLQFLCLNNIDQWDLLIFYIL